MECVLHFRQGGLRQVLDVGQHIGPQFGQEVGAQVLDRLDRVLHGVRLPLESGVRRSGGLVHFRRFSGQVFRLRSRHGQHGGLCLDGREQARERQFVPAHGVL